MTSVRMTISDVLSREGRDPVVTGVLELGSLRAGDEVSIEHGEREVASCTVSGIETDHRVIDSATAGMCIGVRLTALDPTGVQPGDHLVSGVAAPLIRQQ